jgi:hypothetical protein
MVRLAREITANVNRRRGYDLFAREILEGNNDMADEMLIALAALQHVEKLVLDARNQRTPITPVLAVCDHILTAIGSNRHD